MEDDTELSGVDPELFEVPLDRRELLLNAAKITAAAAAAGPFFMAAAQARSTRRTSRGRSSRS